MLLAVPAIMLIAASTLAAFKSGIFSSAIFCTSALLMVATLVLFGTAEADFRLQAFLSLSLIHISGVRSRLKDFAARYNLDPEVMYPHSFRHRFAKNFIEHSGDISLLSDLLGHESLETTRIYLRRSSTEQARIVNQVVNW